MGDYPPGLSKVGDLVLKVGEGKLAIFSPYHPVTFDIRMWADVPSNSGRHEYNMVVLCIKHDVRWVDLSFCGV